MLKVNKIHIFTFETNIADSMKPILCIATLLAVGFSLKAQPINKMLVAGGHSYEVVQFFQMFRTPVGLGYEPLAQPLENKTLADGTAAAFDVLVFSDIWGAVSASQKKESIDQSIEGNSFLFLHNVLVTFQDFPEFENLPYGNFVLDVKHTLKEHSTYKHDVWVEVEVFDDRHPVFLGTDDFRIFDEVCSLLAIPYLADKQGKI